MEPPVDRVRALTRGGYARLRFSEIYQDGRRAEGQDTAVVDRAYQLKTHLGMTFPAAGEKAFFQQGGFVHQAMGCMLDAVNAGGGHFVAGFELSGLHLLWPLQGPDVRDTLFFHRHTLGEQTRGAWNRNQTRDSELPELQKLPELKGQGRIGSDLGKVGVFTNMVELSDQAKFDWRATLATDRQPGAFLDEKLVSRFAVFMFQMINTGIFCEFTAYR